MERTIQAENLPSPRWGFKTDATVTHDDGYMYAQRGNAVDMENLLEEGGTHTLPEEVRACVHEAIARTPYEKTFQPDPENEFKSDND